MNLKKIKILVLSIICIGCAGSRSEIKISDFKQGLVRFDATNQPEIYQEGNEFPHENNGTCTGSKSKAPCQWYGFEFTYYSPEDVTRFDCVSNINRPQRQVYPGRLVKENTSTLKWGFTLTGHKGHYLRPQYTYDLKGAPMRSEYICSVHGKEVLKWDLTLIPINADAEKSEKNQTPSDHEKYVGVWVVTYENTRLEKLMIYPDHTALFGGRVNAIYTWNIINKELTIYYKKNNQEIITGRAMTNGDNELKSIAEPDAVWHHKWSARKVSSNPAEKINLYELCTTREHPNVWQCQNVGSDEYCSGTVPWKKTTSENLQECISQCEPLLQERLDSQIREQAKLESCKK